MLLAHEFTQSSENDYEEIAAAGGRLRALLDAFAGNTLPGEYTEEQLANYAGSLLARQREDGSFSSYPRPEELEADVRTDAHRFVTWAALAFLCRFQDLSVGIPGIEADVLEKSILSAMRSPVTGDFAFPESGEAEPVQQVEAVLVLSSGGVPGRVMGDSRIAPVLSAELGGLKADFLRRIRSGDTILPGGIDYKDLFLKALAGLEQ